MKGSFKTEVERATPKQVEPEQTVKQPLDEYGIPSHDFVLPDSGIEVTIREPRLGDIRVAELDIARLKQVYGEFSEDSINATLPILSQVVIKFGDKVAQRKSNGLTKVPAISIDDFDLFSMNDIKALGETLRLFRGFNTAIS